MANFSKWLLLDSYLFGQCRSLAADGCKLRSGTPSLKTVLPLIIESVDTCASARQNHFTATGVASARPDLALSLQPQILPPHLSLLSHPSSHVISGYSENSPKPMSEFHCRRSGFVARGSARSERNVGTTGVALGAVYTPQLYKLHSIHSFRHPTRTHIGTHKLTPCGAHSQRALACLARE